MSNAGSLMRGAGWRLGQLTAANLRRPMAVIINNKVYMAPRIMSKITNRFQISGDFKKEQVEQLGKALNEAAAKP